MAKYIDADKMLKEYEHGIYDTTDLAEMLHYMPAEDVQEVRHGRWVEFSSLRNMFSCSLCGQWGDRLWNYCPNCGSRMDLDGDAE